MIYLLLYLYFMFTALIKLAIEKFIEKIVKCLEAVVGYLTAASYYTQNYQKPSSGDVV